ncbi:MAG TPA: S9 family peptidase [Hyphomicrobiaceae bacterium]|nr:S9 family peptidase [Hyphomicrobiaceae bacterium]
MATWSALEARGQSPALKSDSAGPTALREPKTFSLHGTSWVDEYHWLAARNWNEVRSDPTKLEKRIRDHLEAENRHTAATLAETRALQAKLYAEMRGRIVEADTSVPLTYGAWSYYRRTVKGGQRFKMVRRPLAGGAEEVLVDGDRLAAGSKEFSLFDKWLPSPDHTRIVYAVDPVGSESYTIRVRDLRSRRDLPDSIPNTNGRAVWSLDGQWLYYVRLDDDSRPLSVYRHRLGTSPSADILVYKETDLGFYVDVSRLASGRYIAIESGTHQTSEIRLVDARAPEAPPRMVAARRDNIRYSVEIVGERLITLTNADGALDNKIIEAPLASFETSPPRELVPHVPGRVITWLETLDDQLIWLEETDGLPRIMVRRLSDGREHAVSFGDGPHVLGIHSGYEQSSTELIVSFEAPTTPVRYWKHDVTTEKRVVIKETRIPSGHRPDDYVTRRLMAKAADGELVPITFFHRADRAGDPDAPLYLTGYGAYGVASKPRFERDILSLVDRGFTMAIAHVRGGNDRGERWYVEGRGEKKPNTFSDFIAAAEHLIAEGHVKRGNIVIAGASAGGMLVGAVANARPELFLGVIADVPFVDVLATMLDASQPLTQLEYPEWGNPEASKSAFDLIRSYSPYDNVRAQPYPHILATGAISDRRVAYWEPAKWVARLRAMRTNRNLLLLHTNFGGHGGPPGRFERLRDEAMRYAFALKITGRTRAELPRRARTKAP